MKWKEKYRDVGKSDRCSDGKCKGKGCVVTGSGLESFLCI